MFKENKYTRWYNNIVCNAINENRVLGACYFEKHHIIPKALGGTDEANNLVLLTAKEHFVCHSLLPRMCIEESHVQKMAFAINAMRMVNQQQKRLSAKQYDYNKKVISENMSTYFKEKYAKEDHHSKGTTSWAKGLVWIHKGDEIKRVDPIIAENMIDAGWSYGHNRSTQRQKEVASKTHKNKKVSKETRKKLSFAHKGKTNATRDMKYINLTGVVKRVKMEELDNYLNKGWNLGRGPHSWSTRPKGQ